MKAGIISRIRQLEAFGGPGSGPAMIIDWRPGEPHGEAEARYFEANPERRGDTRTPRIYLCLAREVPCEMN